MMDTLNKKYILLSLLISIFVSNFVFASCGSCQVQAKPVISEKSNSLVTTIPESGEIEGFAIASCGMCNFDYKGSKGCSLTIKIGDTIYPVEGTNIHKHGDPHSEEGMCSAIRVAYISGKIKDNKLYSDSFTLIESPE
jgi:hypothetical protein